MFLILDADETKGLTFYLRNKLYLHRLLACDNDLVAARVNYSYFDVPVKISANFIFGSTANGEVHRVFSTVGDLAVPTQILVKS